MVGIRERSRQLAFEQGISPAAALKRLQREERRESSIPVDVASAVPVEGSLEERLTNKYLAMARGVNKRMLEQETEIGRLKAKMNELSMLVAQITDRMKRKSPSEFPDDSEYCQ